ncbi:MAG: Gfo/Idh/MocA family oxidoreductase [Candidatus Nanopelagicales bacterium]|nr:Gfo/Idh/MocA family oxidoreductase [Candidatus Nanopelagicales bacterium]
MRDVGWGVLGAGWLVTRATGEALRSAAGARVVAAGARDLDRARSVGALRAYNSYRAVIEDPDVEAVYICLANDAHLPMIRMCIEAGKHVLCEKPMVLSAADAASVFEQAAEAGVLLVEATWSRWHPRMRRIVELVADGAIGDIHAFLGTFTGVGPAPDNYRHSPDMGGGALYDVGVYPLQALLACLPEVEEFQTLELEHVRSDRGIDLTTKAALSWGAGTHATIVASFVMPASQRLVIRGTGGEIRVEDDQAFTSWRTPSELWIDGRIESFPAADAYQVMFEEVSASIRGEGGWVLPARDSIRVARAVDALR